MLVTEADAENLRTFPHATCTLQPGRRSTSTRPKPTKWQIATNRGSAPLDSRQLSDADAGDLIEQSFRRASASRDVNQNVERCRLRSPVALLMHERAHPRITRSAKAETVGRLPEAAVHLGDGEPPVVDSSEL